MVSLTPMLDLFCPLPPFIDWDIPLLKMLKWFLTALKIKCISLVWNTRVFLFCSRLLSQPISWPSSYCLAIWSPVRLNYTHTPTRSLHKLCFPPGTPSHSQHFHSYLDKSYSFSRVGGNFLDVTFPYSSKLVPSTKLPMYQDNKCWLNSAAFPSMSSEHLTELWSSWGRGPWQSHECGDHMVRLCSCNKYMFLFPLGEWRNKLVLIQPSSVRSLLPQL